MNLLVYTNSKKYQKNEGAYKIIEFQVFHLEKKIVNTI